MKCPVCNGTKKFHDSVEQWKKVSTPRSCPNGNCIAGLHMVPRDPAKDKIGVSSSVLYHGMDGKALCPKCRGRGCKHCRNTGMFGIPCNKCAGTGWVWHTEWYYIHGYQGEEKHCLYCQEGQYAPTGTLGEVLIEALGSEICKTKHTEGKEEE